VLWRSASGLYSLALPPRQTEKPCRYDRADGIELIRVEKGSGLQRFRRVVSAKPVGSDAVDDVSFFSMDRDSSPARFQRSPLPFPHDRSCPLIHLQVAAHIMEIAAMARTSRSASSPADVHAESVNPFRVIPGVTPSSGSEVGLGVCDDVFQGKSHDLCLPPQNLCKSPSLSFNQRKLFGQLSLIQCGSHHSTGFTKIPWSMTEKWRWSPPASPVSPVTPTGSPFFTS